MFESRDPSNAELLSSVPPMSFAEVDDRLNEVRSAFVRAKAWSDEEWMTRLKAFRAALLKSEEPLARLISLEMGKPLQQSRAEIRKSSELMEYAAEVFTQWKEPFLSRHRVSLAPLGVILAIMPWNFPVWQTLRAAFSVWLGRNALLVKPAPNVLQTNEWLMKLMNEAELPASLMLTDVSGTEKLISDSRIAGVTLTGSTRAGERVGSLAGAALKKVVLELGGSDAYLILKDADLEKAISCCVESRLINTGQSCVAAKRFFVHESRREEFLDQLCAEVQKKTMGAPLRGSFDLGPLARQDLKDSLLSQRDRSILAGAQEIFRSPKIDSPGFFTPVSVLADVPLGSAAFQEETFGPLFAVASFSDENEVVEWANESRWGLGAAVFSADQDRAERLAQKLDVGLIAVNDFVRSQPRAPFGGVKASGLGRELGPFAPYEFINFQTWI